MPTYDYVCNNCAHAFEEFQSIKAKPLKSCPKCGKRTLERLIGTGSAIIFKGSGFYQTDYRGESYKQAAEADKPKPVESKPDAKPDAQPDTKAATKPDAKAESKPASKPTIETKPTAAEPAKKARSSSAKRTTPTKRR